MRRQSVQHSLHWVALVLLVLQGGGKLWAAEGIRDPFDSFEYGPLLIQVEPGTNLKKLGRKINIRKIPGIYQSRLEGLKSPDPRKQCGAKMVFLLERVKAILNMFPTKKRQLIVRVMRNQKSFDVLARRFGRGHHKAFYHVKENTIYLSASKVNEYVLAHELAHAVIENYFIVRSPANVQELLAIHCDKSLKDASIQ